MRIRAALPEDLPRLQRIEEAADALLTDLLRPAEWTAAPSGEERAASPGFLLVASEESDVVGFVHVLESAGIAHLEQVSVLPAFGRRGTGRALVAAALERVAAKGYGRMTVRTYADVPWNAPFYAGLGFVESTPDTLFLRSLVDAEERLGRGRWGRRVQMTAYV